MSAPDTGESVDPKDPAVRADAADRFDAEVKAAQAAIWRAIAILREQQPRSSSGRFYPLFTWGERLYDSLGKSLDALHEAHREVAVQAYDEHVKAGDIGGGES